MRLLLLGGALTLTFWAVSWSRIPYLSEHAFFPLWLGYTLLVNGICDSVFGDSLLRRMGYPAFMLLYLISVPFWWFFEFANEIVQNWEYVLPTPISTTEYIIRASISFSTVIPAVLSTAFVVGQLLWRRGYALKSRSFRIRLRWLAAFVLIGIIALLLVKAIPRTAFPLVWIAPILLLEPFLYLMRIPSLLRKIEMGEWRIVVSVMLGTMVTGVLWEMWNFYSLPYWVYHIPYVGFWKIFQMPFLGYFGYPFFGLIVYSYFTFVFSALLGRNTADRLFCPPIVRDKEDHFRRVRLNAD
jgi:hypothetical protein